MHLIYKTIFDMNKKTNATIISDSDFDHLKLWKENTNLDYYLSDEHWNFHVNRILRNNLLVFHEGKEVGAFLKVKNPDSRGSIIDHTSLYGNMFNEAYRLCQSILTIPVPETKVAHFAKESSTWIFKNLKDIDGNPLDSVIEPNVIDLIVSYHILGMVNAILCFANDHSASIDRFLITLSVYKDNGLPFCGYIHCFEPYNLVYQKLIFATLVDGSNLRPGYDHKKRDEHMRENIPWYNNIAKVYEKNLKEKKKIMVEEPGEHYYGKNVTIFHENLDPKKIAREIIAIDRKNMGERHFCFILYAVFNSLTGCLITKSKPKFLDWVKYNCSIYFESNDLKKIILSDDEKLKIDEYKAIFADKQIDGRWIFNKKFYKIDSQGNPLQGIEMRG